MARAGHLNPHGVHLTMKKKPRKKLTKYQKSTRASARVATKRGTIRRTWRMQDANRSPI